MKIIPNYDMLIDGNHCPVGVPVDASDATAKSLLAQRLATVAADATATTSTGPTTVIETADAPAAPETAALKPAKRARK